VQCLFSVPALKAALRAHAAAPGGGAGERLVGAARELFADIATGGESFAPYKFLLTLRERFPQFAQQTNEARGVGSAAARDATAARAAAAAGSAAPAPGSAARRPAATRTRPPAPAAPIGAAPIAGGRRLIAPLSLSLAAAAAPPPHEPKQSRVRTCSRTRRSCGRSWCTS
jgi:hypothetical protein